MSTQLLNKAVVAQFIAEACESFDGQHLHHLLADDFQAHLWASLGAAVGVEGMRELISATGAAYSAARVRVHDLISEGEKVVARYVFEADRAGKRIRTHGILIARLREGRISELWREEDGLETILRLGALSA